MANKGSGTVSVVNGDKTRGADILVGGLPISMAENQETHKIYVANALSGTVSIINGSSGKRIYSPGNDIPVGYGPSSIAVDTDTNKIYVANSLSNSVSVIDGSSDKVVAGVIFNVNPANSGNIVCNNADYPIKQYVYSSVGTRCIAKPNRNFEFSSWVENLGHNATLQLSSSTESPLNSLNSIVGFRQNDSPATLNLTKYGTFTANFNVVPPPIPPQYWIPLCGIIVSTVVGWSIPSIMGWIKAEKQARRCIYY